MTIEMTSSQSHQRDVAQLKEICGVSEEEAQKAYKDGGYNVEKAVELLTIQKNQATNGKTMHVAPYRDDIKASSSQMSAAKGNVVDLTASEEDEIRRAIALSLQHSFQPGASQSGISQEDEEISRVLEESIAANQEMASRGRIDPWMMFADPLNPHERTREGDTPVGLKNVGNTCWFSAVIQSLFHLPIVRKHILSYKMPSRTSVPTSSPESDQTLVSQNAITVLKFMEELRILFSLLVGSKRKYVNPQKPVEILKSAFTASSSQFSYQQDVSEFNHKLLEWLQDAFHLQQVEENRKSNETQETFTERNPVVRLFYGKCKTEGTNEGKSFDNECFFSSLPVQVQGHHDLHSCLEASLVHREIEPVSSSEATCVKAEQVMWFLELPPILTIELSRFEFNQTKQKAEKIHDKLTFSKSIYMDRYLECNKVDVTARRESVYKLRRKLDILERQLDKFTSYKSKRVALRDVFDLALGFACTKRMRYDDCKRDEDIMETSPQTLQNTSLSQNGIVVEPCPRHVTEEELKTLQTCLTRWRKEVDEDQQGLRDDISEVVNHINEMYTDPSLTQVLYQLYAVLVHEGEAAGGHYWAYIRPNLSDVWLKFNDISVIEVAWDEVERESMGEHQMASAYCLIYVDHSKQDWIGCHNEPVDLPPDLQLVVGEDNEKLQDQIREYDNKQEEAQLFPSSQEAVRNLGPRPDVIGREKQPLASNVRSHGFATEPERPQEVVVEEQLTSAVEVDSLNSTNIDTYVSAVFTKQYTLLRAKFRKQVENLSLANDTRLAHLCCYMIASNAPQALIDLAIYEVILKEIPLDAIPSNCHLSVQNAAYRKMRSSSTAEDHTVLKDWKHYYEKYCETAAYFVKALDYVSSNSYSLALSCTMTACQLNNHLMFPSCPAACFDKKTLASARQHCLKRVNEEALNLFINPEVDSTDEAMHLIRGLIIPCFSELERSDLSSDLEVKEEVRETWCRLVSGDNLGANRQERLQEVLEKLFDVSSSRLSEVQAPPIPQDLMTNLFQQYTLIVENFQRN